MLNTCGDEIPDMVLDEVIYYAYYSWCPIYSKCVFIFFKQQASHNSLEFLNLSLGYHRVNWGGFLHRYWSGCAALILQKHSCTLLFFDDIGWYNFVLLSQENCFISQSKLILALP